MRVAFVSNVVYPFVTGGAEKRIHEIGTRLAEDGHDVTVYGRHFRDGPRETTHDGMTLRAVAPEADLYADDRRSIAEAIDLAARALPSVRGRLRRDEHDVVVASVFPYFPVLVTKLAALRTDTPLVTTWHEVWRDYWGEYLGSLAPFGKAVERLTARTPQHPPHHVRRGDGRRLHRRRGRASRLGRRRGRRRRRLPGRSDGGVAG